jgi:putative ABC transport system permease protein
MLRNLRYACRSLLRSRGFSAVAVGALALGIGANTAIFTFIDAVMLRPLPYPRAGSLVELSETEGGRAIPADFQDYLDWKAQAHGFEAMGFSAALPGTVAVNGAAESTTVAYVSPDFFQVLGVRAALGRGLLADDDQAGSARVVVATHEFWMTRLGGDAGVIGRSLRVGGEPHTLVGVLPPWFRYHREAALWTVTAPSLDRFGMAIRGNHNNGFVVARLRPGAPLASARAEMETVARRLAAAYPATNTGVGVAMRPLREVLAGGVRKTALVLLGAVGLVLLIACLNVANLLLARSAARRKEFAVRAALGAGRAALVRQGLLESLVLAATGGALGVGVALAGMRVLAALLPWGFAASDLRLDGPVLGFTAALALVAALVFGGAPALAAARVNLADALKQGGRGTGRGATGRQRAVLVVSEVAVATMLLAGAGLLIESFWRLARVDAGLRPERLLTVELPWPYEDFASAARMPRFYAAAVERVRALPGVRAAGSAWLLPLAGSSARIPVYRADRPVPERGRFPQALYNAVSPGFFEAAGIPLLRGRVFNERDGAAHTWATPDEMRAAWSRAVYKTVVSQAMACSLWPGEDPIGKRFRFGTPSIGGPWLEVAGIAGDVRHLGLDRASEPQFYIPAFEEPREQTLIVRSAGDPAALAAAVRATVRELDPNVPTGKVRTMEEVIGAGLASRRTNMLLVAAFAALALLLAAAGIYGVVGYAVAARMPEFGVRLALGATRRDIYAMVLGEAGALAGAGCALGALAALALSRWLAGLLFEVRPGNPATYAGVILLLMGVALASAALPARRATRADPVSALRCD